MNKIKNFLSKIRFRETQINFWLTENIIFSNQSKKKERLTARSLSAEK